MVQLHHAIDALQKMMSITKDLGTKMAKIQQQIRNNPFCVCLIPFLHTPSYLPTGLITQLELISKMMVH